MMPASEGRRQPSPFALYNDSIRLADIMLWWTRYPVIFNVLLAVPACQTGSMPNSCIIVTGESA